MPRTVFFGWEGTEYAFEEKSADWYWALGIIAIAGAVAAVLFSNIILALLILVASGALALVQATRPKKHRFRITDQGVMIDENVYTYDDIHSFSVLEYVDPNLPPALSLKTHKLLAPHLLIPINGHDPEAIYNFFIEHVPEGRHEESVVNRIIELLKLG